MNDLQERTLSVVGAKSIEQAELGTIFLGPVRHLSIERVLAFSGGAFSRPNWPDRNLHTDLEKAQEAGLAGVIVSATQFEGHLIDLLIDLFGEKWFTAGVIETRIPKSLMLDDFLQTKAVLREVRDDIDGRTFALDVSCENQRGEQVLVGTASCRLPRPATAQTSSPMKLS
jgi:hypothetical protein